MEEVLWTIAQLAFALVGLPLLAYFLYRLLRVREREVTGSKVPRPGRWGFLLLGLVAVTLLYLILLGRQQNNTRNSGVRNALQTLAWEEDFALRREALDLLATGALRESGAVGSITATNYLGLAYPEDTPPEELDAIHFLMAGETALPVRINSISLGGELLVRFHYGQTMLQYDYTDQPPTYPYGEVTDLGGGWVLEIFPEEYRYHRNVEVSTTAVSLGGGAGTVFLVLFVCMIFTAVAWLVASLRSVYIHQAREREKLDD